MVPPFSINIIALNMVSRILCFILSSQVSSKVAEANQISTHVSTNVIFHTTICASTSVGMFQKINYLNVNRQLLFYHTSLLSKTELKLERELMRELSIVYMHKLFALNSRYESVVVQHKLLYGEV